MNARQSKLFFALGRREDGTVSRAQLEGWREHTSAGCEVELLPGGHFFAEEHVAAASARVRSFLRRVV